MTSVADQLREHSRRRVATLTVEERLRLAYALGDADLLLMCAARSLTDAEGRALIARTRRTGRTPSRSAGG